MITDELQKEMEEAYYDVRWKMQQLEIFLSVFPRKINPAIAPPQVVAEEARVIGEFNEASGRFRKVFQRYTIAYKAEIRQAYYEQTKDDV